MLYIGQQIISYRLPHAMVRSSTAYNEIFLRVRKFTENQMQPRKDIANWAVLKGENNKFSIINWIDSRKQREKIQWTAVSCERYGKRKKTQRGGRKNATYSKRRYECGVFHESFIIFATIIGSAEALPILCVRYIR